AAPPPPYGPPPGAYAQAPGGYGPPPGAPPAPPAPPAAPGPGALFLRRVFTGDWAGSALAALWPVVLLVGLAVALASPSWDSDDDLSWSTRFKLVIAGLLQGLGGTADFSARSEFGAREAGGSISFWLLGMTALWILAVILGARWLRRARPAGAGFDAAPRIGLLTGAVVLVLGLYGQPEADEVEFSTTPVLAALFTFALTALLSAVVLGRDALLTRIGPGAQMAARACGTALRALALVVGLWTAVLFVVVLYQIDKENGNGWSVLGALVFLTNGALLALGISWGADVRGSTGGRLGGDSEDFGWFANDSYGSSRGSFGRSADFGLSEAGDQWGGWAQTGIVVMGVLCALSLTLMVVRRARAGRKEQVLSGVFFLAAVWLTALVAGISTELKGTSSGIVDGRIANTEVGVNGGELLLFGILWTAGAVLLAVLITNGRNRGGAVPGPYGPPGAPPMPYYTPPAPPMGAPTHTPAPPNSPVPPPVAPAPAQPPASPAAPPAEPPTAVDPTPSDRPAPPADPKGPAASVVAPPAPRRGRFLRWTAVGAAAFVVGGVAAAGVLLVHKDGKGDAKDGRDNHAARQSTHRTHGPDAPAPLASGAAAPATPSPADSASPADPASPSAPTPPPASAPSGSPGTGTYRTAAPDAHERATTPTGDAPKYYERVSASEGFTLAVPEGWRREDKGSGQIDWHGPTGPEHLRVGIVKKTDQAAYEHFQELEKTVGREDGYQRLQMVRNTFKGRPGALWEWTWNDDGRTMHAVNQAYVDESGTEYAILFQGRDGMGDPGTWHRTFDTALDHWSAGKG
ncbi:hypothetical protein, partial [Streptomyces sp. I05A-00742]|uniref:hypothetical protein n=1 Tax=Streptomyces sp. I05A-00742 TaxID=2732853 RepID=UPI001BB278A9